MRTRTLILLAALCAGTAQAQEVKIGTSTIRLTPPIGHCVLSDSDPSDARALGAARTSIPPSNRLLAMTANCRVLGEWRAGKLPNLRDTAQFQTLHNAPDQSGDPAGAVREVCQVMRAQGGELISKVPGPANERLKNATLNIKVNETRFLGVLAEEPQVCYAGAVLKLRAEQGHEVTTATLFAITIVKGRMLFYYLSAPFAEGQALSDLLVRHKANVATFRAANSGR